jgi:hypothetical protein
MRNLTKFTAAALLATAALAFAELSGSYLVPLDHEAIQYAKRPTWDPITRLGSRINAGEVSLEFDETHGYLRGVLKALNIPIESQVLVFSKTSFQATRISPRMPRAIYFNDDTTIGFVRGSDVLEVTSQDPHLGIIFYTLDQEKVDKPRFERRDTACLQCHASGGTLGVPGLVVRSVYPEPNGMPMFQAGTFVSDHRSPLKERWGGWYVTGTHGETTHMGNSVVRDRDRPEALEGTAGLNLTDLSRKFDTGAYLAPTSDIVALLTLEHQTHMTNLITRVGFETSMALHYQAGLNKAFGAPQTEVSDSTRRRIDSAVEEMVEYMLFTNEVPLEAPVKGVTPFAKTFADRGPRDKKGRSLRDFDLNRRIFRYPLTYMIYSAAFDGMPVEARDRIYKRLHAVLTGQDTGKKFSRLTAEDRRAIFEILRDTKANLPDYWKTAAAPSAD